MVGRMRREGKGGGGRESGGQGAPRAQPASSAKSPGWAGRTPAGFRGRFD
jgi:hypothetical protein